MKRVIMSIALAASLVFTTSTLNPAKAGDPVLGSIIGAVGGGLLGSTLGKGNGRLVATAAGSVIGAVIGREIATDNDPYYDDRTHRRDTVNYRDKKKVVIVEKDKPRYKKWKRVARYGDDVIVCRGKANRCQWYD